MGAVALLLSPGCGGRAAEQAGRFDVLVMESRAAEGEQVLKQASVLQEAYRADNQRYATTFAELQEVGWEPPPGLRFYQAPRIVRAGRDALCIVIEPRQAELWAQHVDQTGQVKRGPCP
jgi:hypothetical protein